ncbi:sensor histidine kinase [Solibaculum mannosilyticum]|uniref:sensor histidine kinase n=1 Tax=Solibaculum mannosilyticum TaxID=2780922 RepID=UPI0007A86364|nr:Sensor histidine kinase GraS [Eubacteriaceae bacterium CHKCI005]
MTFTFWEYAKDKTLTIVLNILCMFFLAFYLIALGNEAGSVALILVVWGLLLAAVLIVGFLGRKRYFKNLMETAQGLEQRYLIAEVMERPVSIQDRQFYTLLRMANKSMMERITDIQHERRDYKDYIEQWVHEIKTPISAIKLICENNRSDATRKVLSELESTERYVEQALFYARSENVEKDYLIKEVPLSQCVHGAIAQNKRILLSNQMGVQTDGLEKTVYTDSKWLEFMLDQLLINAVQYRRESGAVIRIWAEDVQNGVRLCVEDNGIGIEASDLPRVFDKGFTGQNGRSGRKSTGIGLYLCRRLAEKLGLELSIQSRLGEFTRVTLCFPKGTFVKVDE